MMKKLLFILLLLPLFAMPQAKVSHRQVFLDTLSALNDSIFEIKDTALFKATVGIGDSVNASAMLDITSTAKGILVPRMTTIQKNAIGSPATGLMIYDTDNNCFEFYTGAIWQGIGFGISDSSYVNLQADTIEKFHNDNIYLKDTVRYGKTIIMDKTTDIGDVISIKKSGVPRVQLGMLSGGAGQGLWYDDSGANIAVRIGGNNSVMNLYSGGIIKTTISGIGISTFEKGLTVGDGSASFPLKVLGFSGASVFHVTDNVGTPMVNLIWQASRGGSIRLQDNGGGATVWFNGSTLDSFWDAGELAIGHQTPTAALHIAGADATSSNSWIKGGDNAGTIYLWGRNDGNTIITGSFNYYADTSSVNDSYGINDTRVTAYMTGMVIYFSAGVANTGACTIQFNALAAISLKSLHDQDPPDNYIEVGSIIHCIYDGTNFQMLQPDANP